MKDFLDLNDIYVEPDLKGLDDDETKFIVAKKLNPSKLHNKHDFAYIVGDKESGKTVLAKKIAQELLEKGILPVFWNGKSLRDIKANEIIRKFGKKYDLDYEYLMSFEEKALIIDDFDLFEFDSRYIEEFQSNTKHMFNKAYFFMSESEFFIRKTYLGLFDSFECFQIPVFGYLKRNELYKKWFSVGSKDLDLIERQKLDDKVSFTAQQFDSLLKKNIIDSKPIYILTILQTLDGLTSRDYSLSSYGDCYSTLLMAMLNRCDVPHNDFDGIITFISQFSFYLYINDKYLISSSEYMEYFSEYQKKYNIKYDMKKILLKSGILFEDSESKIRISQKYIYYFCCAKYISDNYLDQEVVITDLCGNMHNEHKANILIFLIHHLRSTKLLDEILVHSMCLLNGIPEFDINQKFSTFFSSIMSTVSELTIDIKNRNELNKKALAQQDAFSYIADDASLIQQVTEQNGYNVPESEGFKPEIFNEVNSALKSIEVLGQIAKNRQGSLEFSKLNEILTVAYSLGLKSLQFYLEFLFNNENELREFLKNMIIEHEKLSNFDAAEKSKKIIFQLFDSLCFLIIKNISFATSHPKLVVICDNIADSSNSAAIKLIQLTTRLNISNELPKDLILDLKKIFDKSALGTRLLRQIMVYNSYVNNTPIRDIQWISEKLNISISNQVKINTKLEFKK